MAVAVDPPLAKGAPVLTRRTLPPRLPPASFATPGAPSPGKPGIYIADRSRQLAEAQAEAEAAAGQQYYNGASDGSPSRNQPSSPLRKSGGSTGGGRSNIGGGSTRLQPIVDYAYPELGHSVVAQQQAELKATTLKSARLDVYGQPRGDMPQVCRSCVSFPLSFIVIIV